MDRSRIPNPTNSDLKVWAKYAWAYPVLESDVGQNLCAECHKTLGCGRTHGIYFYDTGHCDNCGKVNELVNCKIAHRIEDLGISDRLYYETRLPRIRK